MDKATLSCNLNLTNKKGKENNQIHLNLNMYIFTSIYKIRAFAITIHLLGGGSFDWPWQGVCCWGPGWRWGKLAKGHRGRRCAPRTASCACLSGRPRARDPGRRRGCAEHGWPPPDGLPFYSATWTTRMFFFNSKQNKTYRAVTVSEKLMEEYGST